jgi:superfamily II DNA or RNA helicase
VESGTRVGDGAVVPLAPAGWRPTQPLYQRWAGGAFTYNALNKQTTMLQALAAEPGYKTLVILDEIHRVGAERGWGMAAQQALGAAATRILSLSGTPFRTRGRGSIAFAQTADWKSIADYAYSYGDALTDGECRPLWFAAIGG